MEKRYVGAHLYLRSYSLWSINVSVFLRDTESDPGRYLFTIAGDIDSDKIITNHEYLKDTLRTLSERSDILFGDIVYVTDYRYVCFCREKARMDLSLIYKGQASGW